MTEQPKRTRRTSAKNKPEAPKAVAPKVEEKKAVDPVEELLKATKPEPKEPRKVEVKPTEAKEVEPEVKKPEMSEEAKLTEAACKVVPSGTGMTRMSRMKAAKRARG